MQLQFLQAEPRHQAAIDKLFGDAFSPYVAALGNTTGPGPYTWLDDYILKKGILIVCESDEVVGAIAVDADTLGDDLWVVEQVAVAPNWQKRGVGEWMLKQFIGLATERGIETITLYTAKKMSYLIRFYQSHGFVVVREGPPTHGQDSHIRAHMETVPVTV